MKYTSSEMVALGRAIEERKRGEDEFAAKQGAGGGGDRKSNDYRITSASGDAEVIDQSSGRVKKPNERLNDAVGEVIGRL